MEGGRFSGNPVSGADSECNREVTFLHMPRKQDCPKICALQDGGVPRNSTREVECCSGRAPGGRLSCGLANVQLKFVDEKVIY